MSENLINFKNYLKKMFRKEDSNFNWGVYRIINQCNKEIDDFVDNQIPLIIKSQIKEKGQISLKEIDNQIEDLIIKCKETGTDYKTSEKYKNLMSQKEKFGTKDLDISIYDNLLNFFLRYYQDGDFISRHYYSDGLKQEYMIPYDGSETYLYWPTKDQYYIKSSDQYKRFSFELGKINVAFIVTQADQEKNNVKEKGKKFFSLALENPFEWNENKTELIVKFTHGIEENPESDLQKKYNTESIKKINQFLEESKIKEKLDELNENNENKHTIVKFQKRYTEDFFIHKDLKSFLEFELENYITQEILNTGNLLNSTDLEINKNKILEAKITKQIAEKIIEQLATIENLKKKIWEKKKFVLDTNYVFCLKTVEPQVSLELYTEFVSFLKDNLNKNYTSYFNILNNNLKQPLQNLFLERYEIMSDYIELYYIKRFQEVIDNNLEKLRKDIYEKIKNSGYSKHQILNEKIEKKSNKDYLCVYVKLYETPNNLVSKIYFKDLFLDTCYFSIALKQKLLGEINNFDDIINGIIINSNNFCALNLIKEKYSSNIQLIYIDPPFNTGSDFVYKDCFQNASWLSLMNNLFDFQYLTSSGSMYIHLDENANYFSHFLLNSRFTQDCFQREIIWNTGKVTGYKDKSVPWFRQHDTLLLYSNNKDYKFVKLYNLKESLRKENSLSNQGWLDLYLKDNKYGVYKWNNGILEFMPLNYPDTSVISIGDVWNDIYNRTYTQVQTTEVLDYDTQKPENLLRRIIQCATDENDWVLDYFSGSGTTASTAHKLNRKYIGVDFGQQSNNVMIDRLKGVLIGLDTTHLSKDLNWQGGGFFKYQALEQYEDALENIEFKQTQLTLSSDILLKYKLDVLSKDSKTFFGVNPNEDFEDFKIYTLNEKLEKVPTKVDLVETFNYLIGLWVDKYIIKENSKDNNRKYICVKGKVDNDPVFVVWRNLKDIDLKKDKDFIEEELIVGQKYTQLYVNSDCAISGFKDTYTEFRDKLWD